MIPASRVRQVLRGFRTLPRYPASSYQISPRVWPMRHRSPLNSLISHRHLIQVLLLS